MKLLSQLFNVVECRGGMYILCLHREGEGGTPQAESLRKLNKGGCMKMLTRGEGVKKSETFAGFILT